MRMFLISTMLWAAPALAFEPPVPPPGPPDEAELGMGEFEGVADKLGLDATQKEKVRQIVFESNQARIDLQARSQKAEAELKHLLSAQTLDEKAVLKSLDALNAAEGELRKNRVQLALNLRKVVSAEQWSQLQDLRRERMRERMGEHGGRGGGGRGDGPPPVQ